MDHGLAWRVKYEGLPETAGRLTERVTWKHRRNNKDSVAIHVFGLGEKDGAQSHDEIIAKLEQDPNFSFQFGYGDQFNDPYHHTAIQYQIDRVTSKLPLLKVWSTDQLTAKAALARKPVAYKSEDGKVSDIVKLVVKDLELETDLIEDSLACGEFSKLIVPLDWDLLRFVREHLIPRSGSHFTLYTNDGKKASFCSLGYQMKDFKPESTELRRVIGLNSQFRAARTGGSKLILDGIETFTKKTFTVESEGAVPSLGTVGPMHSSDDGVRLSANSKDAYAIMVQTRHLRHSYGAPFSVIMIGAIKPYLFPAKLSLEGTKYATNDQTEGIVVEWNHIYKSGTYLVKATCLRDLTN